MESVGSWFAVSILVHPTGVHWGSGLYFFFFFLGFVILGQSSSLTHQTVNHLFTNSHCYAGTENVSPQTFVTKCKAHSYPDVIVCSLFDFTEFH